MCEGLSMVSFTMMAATVGALCLYVQMSAAGPSIDRRGDLVKISKTPVAVVAGAAARCGGSVEQRGVQLGTVVVSPVVAVVAGKVRGAVAA
mmetsp:Transcript_6496/g.13238  ORF Transcript_6496/g.13238 Transcript_6496/m.13238 type:complete len:91 (+) Transcript_6496:592-864(+)